MKTIITNKRKNKELGTNIINDDDDDGGGEELPHSFSHCVVYSHKINIFLRNSNMSEQS